MTASSNSESDSSDDNNWNSSRTEKGPSESPLLINRQRMVRANWEEVQEFLRQLHSRLTHSGFTVCLLSDRGIRQYNSRFRQQGGPTDVLSFPTRERKTDPADYLGDILISVETARKNARRFGLRTEQEIQILVLHGLLHLLGYDHETDQGQMARSERRWRRELGLPQSLGERARQQLGDRPARSGRSLGCKT